VPFCASSNWPGLPLARAPVKAPRSYPNSSDSTSASGMAPQLRWTKGPFRWGLASWMSLANRPLPTPDSPRISTGESYRATFSAAQRHRFIFSLWITRLNVGRSAYSGQRKMDSLGSPATASWPSRSRSLLSCVMSRTLTMTRTRRPSSSKTGVPVTSAVRPDGYVCIIVMGMRRLMTSMLTECLRMPWRTRAPMLWPRMSAAWSPEIRR